MVKSFRHKGLAELFNNGHTKRIAADLVRSVTTRLNALREATALEDLNVPGFDFHQLRGKPRRFSIHVNGPWCITFDWEKGQAIRVDLEQYH